jgi:MFS family permease
MRDHPDSNESHWAGGIKASANDLIRDEEWPYLPHEQALVPGAPGFPDHPTYRRIIYGCTSVLLGLTGGFSNAVIAANLPYLRGSLGLDLSEIAWLPTVYAITNACGGGILFKFRQQFGVRVFALIFITLHLILIVGHLFVQGMTSAILVRAADGFAATAITTLALFYMMQAFPREMRLRAVVLGIAVPQLAIPLARLVPIDLMAFNEWRGLYLLEFGLSALSLAAVLIIRLPPGNRRKAFEPLDFVTMPFYIGGVACLGSALGLGPYLWWTDWNWIGECLAASSILFSIVYVIERGRAQPLIDVEWLGGMDLLRFGIVMVITRIVLSEQATGAIGMLRLFGLVNENFRDLSLVLFIAAAAGPVAAAILIKPERTTHIVMLSIGLVAVASYFDSFSSDLTRASQFYLTQAVIAFSATLFIGPALIFGIRKVLAEGGQKLASFVILFAVTQSVGSLVGGAVVQSYQFVAERYHSSSLVSFVVDFNPAVENRLARLASLYSPVISDPALQRAEATTYLAQQTSLEANILAYNDVFRFIAILAAATTAFLAAIIVQRKIQEIRGRAIAP